MNHSPEPWRLTESADGTPGIDDARGVYVLLAVPGDCEDGDLRRIVACVNACNGLSTGLLEKVSESDILGLVVTNVDGVRNSVA